MFAAAGLLLCESWDEHWIVCSCVFFSQCSWWKMWSHRCTYLQKWTLLPLHRLPHSWALTVRDHVPKVVHTCSKFSFEDLIWLQFNNLTFTAARSGEQHVMTGVRDHTETSNEFSVRSRKFLQSRTFSNLDSKSFLRDFHKSVVEILQKSGTCQGKRTTNVVVEYCDNRKQTETEVCNLCYQKSHFCPLSHQMKFAWNRKTYLTLNMTITQPIKFDI